jgi:glutamine synthetase
MATDDGINLLEPGSTPHDNMIFLVFLCAAIRAVDKYAKLLRASVANVGNEHRLGANEAPPAIVSVFLGEQLTEIFNQLADGKATSSKQGGELKLGVSTLPPLPKDSTDRNRTSPFAFTGNKFEFRMVGSSQSTAGPMFVLNTIVADVLSEIADELEKAKNVKASAQKILSKIAKDHSRIIFNGDNYSAEWLTEATKRGLSNVPSTVESLSTIVDEENVRVFAKHKVLSKTELHARMEILFETYSKMINIEALTMLTIAKRQILPVTIEYSGRLSAVVNSLSSAAVSCASQKRMLEKVCNLSDNLDQNIADLEAAVSKASSVKNAGTRASDYHDIVRSAMQDVRCTADELEKIVDADLWPLPTYAEMLFLR